MMTHTSNNDTWYDSDILCDSNNTIVYIKWSVILLLSTFMEWYKVTYTTNDSLYLLITNADTHKDTHIRQHTQGHGGHTHGHTQGHTHTHTDTHGHTHTHAHTQHTTSSQDLYRLKAELETRTNHCKNIITYCQEIQMFDSPVPFNCIL